MSTVRIGSIAMKGINKAGELKPDADGWYDVYLGALEYDNSWGATYALDPARAILNGDNVFTRRIREGRLFGELGHPRRLPGMTEKQFMARIMDLLETNESHHIKEVVIDTTAKDKHGRPFIAFRGKIKPSGPHREVVEQKIADRDMNLCFSIRSITVDKNIDGKIVRFLTNIVTFDCVGEPGINVADKYNAPALESFCGVSVTPEIIDELSVQPNMYGLESDANLALLDEIRDVVHVNVPKKQPGRLTELTPGWTKRW